MSKVDKLQGRPASVGEFSHRGQFDILKDLHASSCGSVHLARVREQERRFAGPKQVILKRRQVAELGKAKDMLNEYEVLKKLQHPNIIGCYGYFWEFDSQSLYIVLEYANRGDLHTELQVRRELGEHFSNDEVWDIFGQVLLGLAHMHSKGIVHRDVKSLNLLLTDTGHVKVGDFGVSRMMSDQTLYLNSFYGTPLYLSPELVAGQPYSQTTDVWSLGVVLYELLSLQPPFNGACLQDVISAVLRGQYSPIPRFRPAEFEALVAELLTREPHRRPKTTKLVERLARQGKVRSSPSQSTPSPGSSPDRACTPSASAPPPAVPSGLPGVDKLRPHARPPPQPAPSDFRPPPRGEEAVDNAGTPQPHAARAADALRPAGAPSRRDAQAQRDGPLPSHWQERAAVQVVRVRRRSATPSSGCGRAAEVLEAAAASSPGRSPAAAVRAPDTGENAAPASASPQSDVVENPAAAAHAVAPEVASRPPAQSRRDARWEERRRAFSQRAESPSQPRKSGNGSGAAGGAELGSDEGGPQIVRITHRLQREEGAEASLPPRPHLAGRRPAPLAPQSGGPGAARRAASEGAPMGRVQRRLDGEQRRADGGHGKASRYDIIGNRWIAC